MRERLALIVAGTAVALAAVACTPGPISPPRGPQSGAERARPVKGGDSTGTMEMVRQQLLGVWDLVSFDMVAAKGGGLVPVKVRGTLVYDEFSNLTIDITTTDPNAPEAARESNLLHFKGRTVIDSVNSELKLMDLKGNADPSEVLSPERRRKYEITMDTLKLSSIDAAGQVTSVASWQRRK